MKKMFIYLGNYQQSTTFILTARNSAKVTCGVPVKRVALLL